MKKRPATDEEVEGALKLTCWRWNAMNPNLPITMIEWREKQNAAHAEGYIDEKCECGNVFLAFQSLTRCTEEGCPFSDGVSILSRLTGTKP